MNTKFQLEQKYLDNLTQWNKLIQKRKYFHLKKLNLSDQNAPPAIVYNKNILNNFKQIIDNIGQPRYKHCPNVSVIFKLQIQLQNTYYQLWVKDKPLWNFVTKENKYLN